LYHSLSSLSFLFDLLLLVDMVAIDIDPLQEIKDLIVEGKYDVPTELNEWKSVRTSSLSYHSQ